MTLGENIVRLRTQKNWSQGDLADALETVSYTHLTLPTIVLV